MSDVPATERIPALVVSGFLGSGKTTLVRKLLEDAQRSGLRVAFISNELGELGIDRALLGDGDEAFVELAGGCVCCELSDDLVETLQRLWESVHPDRVVIETSGVGLPFDTQLNFWREPVSRWIGDDMAVVVVNAEQVAEGRDLEGTFADQATSADLLVLNKVDLVPDRLSEVETRLRKIEPEAPLVRSVHGDVDVSLLFPPDLGRVLRDAPAPIAPEHHHEHFKTSKLRLEPGVDFAQVESRLLQPGVLRAKGFVDTCDGVRLLQLVGRRIEWSVPDFLPAPELVGQLVVIRRAES